MTRHPLPALQAERQTVIDSFHDIATETLKSLDGLVAGVARVFDAPHAMVVLTGCGSRRTVSSCGKVLQVAASEIIFCDHTILGKDVFVVEDASLDRRFQESSLVAGEAGVRFYAGVPLTASPGIVIGTLCIADTRPRTLSHEDSTLLVRLSETAFALLEGERIARKSLGIALEAERQRALAEERSRDLKLRERQFQQTEALAKIGGWEFDLVSKTLTWSDEVYRICGIPLGTVVTSETALAAYPPDERQRVRRLNDRAFKQGIGYEDTFRLVTPEGTIKWARVAADVETVDGLCTRLFGAVQDISEQHAVQTELWTAANYDVLTGLPNRELFFGYLSRLFMAEASLAPAIRQSTSIGLLLVDIDHLKEINDTLGHAAGDALVEAVARRLVSAGTAGCSVARIGGDEFGVMVEDGASSHRIAEIGAAISRVMQARFEIGGSSVGAQVSIGAALSEPDDTPERLRQKADLALQYAKRSGHGNYAEYRPEMRDAIVRRIEIVRSVDDALNESRILPHYQPIVRLDSREIVGLEALARLRTPDGRILSAGSFHEAFDDHRIAYRLTSQMLGAVAADIRGWLDSGMPIQHVGINVTTADFMAGDICQRIHDAFDRRDVPLKHIAIEVTEMVFMSGNEAAVIRDLESLRDKGALVALDDFGTGFASLRQLQTLPVDVIKIDKSFVDDMLKQAASGPIVEALIDLGRKLGMKVVAEGIETEAQARHLEALVCPLGQGFLFARPCDAATAANLMRRFGQYVDATPTLDAPEALRFMA